MPTPEVVADRPIENSYWVTPGSFLAGEYPRDVAERTSRAKLSALRCRGVTVFIDLTEEDEGLLPYAQWLEGAAHLRFPVPDLSVPRSPDITVAILDAIDQHLQQGEMVYLHCRGGVGRTGVIVGCWLAQHGYPGEAALTRLHELWRMCPKSVYTTSPETWEQEQYVLCWRQTPPCPSSPRYQMPGKMR